MFSAKGQLFLSDFVISGFIFIGIFISLAMIWDSHGVAMEKQHERQELETYSRYAMEALLSTEGQPDDWEELEEISMDNIHSLGIMSGRYSYVDYNKVVRLMNSHEDYDEIKRLIGMDAPGYEFKLEITIYNKNHAVLNSLELGYNGECITEMRMQRLAKGYNGWLYNLKFTGCVTG